MRKALNGVPRYAFDTAAGRWTVMLFVGSAADARSAAALDVLAAHRDLFDDLRASFFGITVDPSDAQQGRIKAELPGIRWFLDYDRKVSTLYGAMLGEGSDAKYLPFWLILDPMQRVWKQGKLADGQEMLAELRQLAELPPVAPTAPVLVVPNILSAETCRHLINQYEQHGGRESGFMREENGITVEKLDPRHKRRADHHLENDQLVAHLKGRISLALKPMIKRAFQFDVTRVERFMVACYDASEGGHFRAHRDNTTKGTAHRRFAVTINLNAGEYEGGDLCFPEFGSRTYRAPTGGAVVFSCSLLHEARPVTKGKRYAFLPFLYDDKAARIREENLAFVAPELQRYRA
jgi:predicted 2-oxoglutarate/Fe(II)-dependent dioxygenase YbiX